MAWILESSLPCYPNIWKQSRLVLLLLLWVNKKKDLQKHYTCLEFTNCTFNHWYRSLHSTFQLFFPWLSVRKHFAAAHTSVDITVLVSCFFVSYVLGLYSREIKVRTLCFLPFPALPAPWERQEVHLGPCPCGADYVAWTMPGHFYSGVGRIWNCPWRYLLIKIWSKL